MSAKPQLVAFDLDGTLADSLPGIAAAVASLEDELGLAHCDVEQVRSWIGRGVTRLVERRLEAAGKAACGTRLREAETFFMAAYRRSSVTGVSLYPGVSETLDRISASGYRLACITNKPDELVDPVLETLGIRDHFAIVLGGDTLARKKPDALPLLHAARQLRATPAGSVMVGDSEIDVRAARAAGFVAVAVDYGYNHGRPIREARPDYIISSFLELPALLDGLSSARPTGATGLQASR